MTESSPSLFEDAEGGFSPREKASRTKREPIPDLSHMPEALRATYFVYRRDRGWDWWAEVNATIARRFPTTKDRDD